MLAGILEIQMSTDLARIADDMNKAKGLVTSAMGSIESAVALAQKAIMGLAAGLTVGLFFDLVKSSIEAQAELKHLADRTGTTVETLSGLKGVAKLSGTSIDEVAGGLQKLSKSMVAAESGTSAQAIAFAKLGISGQELSANMNNPGKMMLVVAKHLDTFNDGAGKTAIMMALMGKGGANLGAVLKDLAEKGELNGKTTTAQAEEAEKFMRLLIKWGAQWKDFYLVLSSSILPVLNDLFGSLVNGGSIAKTFTEYLKQLVAEGKIKEWANDAATAIKDLAAAVKPALEITAAYFALFVVGPAIITGAIESIGALKLAYYLLKLELKDLTVWQVLTTNLTGGISVTQQFGTALGALKGAASLLFAAFAGWEIGTYLRDRFLVVRIAGIEMVNALLKAADLLELGWNTVINSISSLWYGFVGGLGDVLQKIPGFSMAGKILSDSSAVAMKQIVSDQASAKAAYEGSTKAINLNIKEMKEYEYASDRVGKGVVLHTGKFPDVKKDLPGGGGAGSGGGTDPAKAMMDGAIKQQEAYIAAQKVLLATGEKDIEYWHGLEYMTLTEAETQKQELMATALKNIEKGYDAEVVEAMKGIAKQTALGEAGLKNKQDGYNKLAEIAAKRAAAEIEIETKTIDSQRRVLAAGIKFVIATNEVARQAGLSNDAAQFQIDMLGLTTVEIQKLTAAKQIQLALDERIRLLQKDNPNQDTSTERANAAIQTARAQALITESYNKQRDGIFGANEALRKYGEDATNIGKSIESAMTKSFKGMEDALVNFVKTGKLDFKSLADSIITDLIRIEIQKSIMQPLAGAGGIGGLISSFFSSSVGAGSNASGYAGTMNNPSAFVASANGNVFDSPSLSAYSGGVYDTPKTFAFANGAGVFAEAGPEAVMPLTRGSNGKLGVQASGGGGGVVVNIVESPGNGGQQSRSTNNGVDTLTIMVEQIKSSIAGDISKGSGSVPAAIQRTYNLNRTAGAY